MKDENLVRNYKGYQIVREGNGQVGCPGNEWPGCKYYYLTYNKDGQMVHSSSTLGRARNFVDNAIKVWTPEEKAVHAAFLVSLRSAE